MIVTGIAHAPERLRERSVLPSPELVYLAKMALTEYRATQLFTGLSLGWEQALAKAALEMEIPYIVAIPFPGRDGEWKREASLFYLDLLAKSAEVYRLSDCYTETAQLEGHYWRVERSDLVLALWEYEFQGDTFSVINHSLSSGKEVVNLWKDWQHLYSLRKQRPFVYVPKSKVGAQVYDKNS